MYMSDKEKADYNQWIFHILLI